MPRGRNSSRIAIGAEQHEVGELRQQPAAIGIEQADDQRADHRPFQAAEPAEDHHHERIDQNFPFGARIEREERPAHDPGHAGEERGERGDKNEQPVDVDTDRAHDLAVIDASAHHRTDLRLAVEQPKRQAHHDTEQDEHEAVGRIDDPARQLDCSAQFDRRRHLEVVAAPDVQRHVAQHERDAHRKQHLRQMVFSGSANRGSGRSDSRAG